jgi:membrane protease subunit HflK
MSWNDPGRNRNPWGNRPDRGTADLDEALRNLQRKLSQMLGGNDRGGEGGGGDDGRGGGGGGGRGGGAIRGFGFGTVALVLLGIWALTGFYVVDAAERGLVTRFGKFVASTEPGLRWHVPWPVEARQLINVESVEGVQEQTRMLTSDENLVDINLAVQYRRADPVAYAFNVRDPDQTLKEVSESAIREIVGRSRLDFVLEEGRQEITAKTRELIQRTLDSYKTGIEVTTVNLQGVSVPEQVQSSQRDAIKAREDKERLGLEAQAYANDILPKAKGSAARQMEDAAAYKARIVADADGEAQRFLALLESYERAPGVTRKRLYYETIEEVLGNTNKVLVNTPDGNGNMLYLPLDKLLQERARTLTLDEQRQVPATTPQREVTAPPDGSSDTGNPEARRERGTR